MQTKANPHVGQMQAVTYSPQQEQQQQQQQAQHQSRPSQDQAYRQSYQSQTSLPQQQVTTTYQPQQQGTTTYQPQQQGTTYQPQQQGNYNQPQQQGTYNPPQQQQPTYQQPQQQRTSYQSSQQQGIYEPQQQGVYELQQQGMYGTLQQQGSSYQPQQQGTSQQGTSYQSQQGTTYYQPQQHSDQQQQAYSPIVPQQMKGQQSGPPSSSSADNQAQMVKIGDAYSSPDYQQAQMFQSEPSMHQQTSFMSGGEIDYSGMSTIGDGYSTGGRECEGRLVSVTSRVDESRSHVLRDEMVEHEIRVPRRVVREETFDKVIIVPEVRRTEEIVEDLCKIRERLITVTKPTVVTRVIEVPEVVWIDKDVEGPPQINVVEKTVARDKVSVVERIVDVPQIVYVDVWKEVIDDSLPPNYKDTPIEREVVIDDWRDEIIVTPVEVEVKVDKPVKIIRDVEIVKTVPLDVPVPVEAEVTYEFTMPHLQPNFHKVTYPVYLPRFIEVPVAAELLTPQLNMLAESFRSQIKALENGATTSTASASSTGGGITPVSLQEIEELAAQIMRTDFQTQLQSVDLQSAVMNAWNRGHMVVKPSSSTGGDTFNRMVGGMQGQSSSEGAGQPMMGTYYSVMPGTQSMDGGGSMTMPVSYTHTHLPAQRHTPAYVVAADGTSLYTPPQSVQQYVVPVPCAGGQQTMMKESSALVGDSRRPSFNPLYPMSQSGVKTQSVQNLYHPKGTAAH